MGNNRPSELIDVRDIRYTFFVILYTLIRRIEQKRPNYRVRSHKCLAFLGYARFVIPMSYHSTALGYERMLSDMQIQPKIN